MSNQAEIKFGKQIRIRIDWRDHRLFMNTYLDVPALEFDIPGSGHRFAVHRNFDITPDEYAVTHIDTGFRVGAGETMEEAAQVAMERWASKTPQQIEYALLRAKARTGVPLSKRASVEPPQNATAQQEVS